LDGGMKTCLICDDHAMMREALAGAVALGWPDAAVTEASDYPSAWRAAESAAPDLIISDLIMPGSTPVEGVRRLAEAAPGAPILVVTGNEDDALLLALLKLGVAGFAPKTSKSAVIEAAIRLVLAGGRYLPPRLLDLATREAAPAPAATATVSAPARCRALKLRIAAPTSAEATEPSTTPARTCASCKASAAGKASAPMNRLMVKPTPHSAATP
jgi:DNA-binding NarL/FixJ family response regulator